MIEIQNVTVRFGGVVVLDDVCLHLTDDVIGLIGPNGAGKTTLINAFSGFAPVAEGSIVVNGRDILLMAPHRRACWGLAHTFQKVETVPDLTVEDHLAAVLAAKGIARAERGAEIEHVLEFLDLEPLRHTEGHRFDPYQARVTEIGKCLAGGPRLVLLDEPGGGLSETEMVTLRKTITGIHREFGAQVLLVDHDIELIRDVCPITAVLDFGHLIAYGPTDRGLADEVVKAAYLGRQPMSEALQVTGFSIEAATRKVVDDVSIDVPPGQIVVLLGPNGAGKSELELGIAGLMPASGSVRLGERDLAGKAPQTIRTAGVAAVPEGHQTLAGLSVLDNLRAAGPHLSDADLDEQVARAFEVFPELDALLDRRAGLLSGGQQQMVAIAQALVSRPKVLLIDEMSLGLAILLIEQFTQLALGVADHCHVIAQGRLQFSGCPTILKKDRTLLERAYLG